MVALGTGPVVGLRGAFSLASKVKTSIDLERLQLPQVGVCEVGKMVRAKQHTPTHTAPAVRRVATQIPKIAGALQGKVAHG
jgi:hypothetical protein